MTRQPGVMTGRDAFMQNIASRLGRKSPLQEPPARQVKGVPEHYAAISLTPDERVQLFAKSFGALTGHTLIVRQSEVTQAIPAYVLQIAEELGATGVTLWDDERLRDLGVEQALTDAGIHVVPWREDGGDAFPVEPVSGSMWAKRSKLLQAAERCQLGIVWADSAIANTGTVMLLAQGGDGRSVSLFPGALLTIFRKSDLMTRMGEAFARMKEKYPNLLDLPSSVNLVTGPSRSADIENDLTIGVHGPGKVYVAIIDDET